MRVKKLLSRLLRVVIIDPQTFISLFLILINFLRNAPRPDEFQDLIMNRIPAPQKTFIIDQVKYKNLQNFKNASLNAAAPDFFPKERKLIAFN